MFCPARVLSQSCNLKESRQKGCSGAKFSRTEAIYDFIAPIIIQTSLARNLGGPIGYSRVALSTEKIQERQQQLVLLYAWSSILVFLLAGVVLIYLTRRLTKSIDALMSGVQRITKGDLQTPIKIASADEMGQLAAAFNRMMLNLHEVRERDRAISQMKSEFLTITVTNYALDTISGVLKEVAVLAEKKNLHIELHAPKEGIFLLLMDTEKLRLAFSNLVDNSIRYTLPGGKITVSVEQ